MNPAQTRDDTGRTIYEGSREHAEGAAMMHSDGREYDVYWRDRGRWIHRATYVNGERQDRES